MLAKVVVLGGIHGHIKEAFAKLEALHLKQNFNFALVAGSLFTNDTDEQINDLLAGRIVVPCTTYFSLGDTPLPAAVLDHLRANNDDICQNLHFIGRRTVMKTSDGLRVIALGGHFEANESAEDAKDPYSATYTASAASVLRGANDADILLTSDWPENVRSGSQIASTPGASAPTSQQCIAELCAGVRPRYHFSLSSFFYEREPFVQKSDEGADWQTSRTYVTRFISLASFGNKEKQKWIYAFTIDPDSSKETDIPSNTTTLPLLIPAKKRRIAQQNETYSRFSNAQNGHDRGGLRRFERGHGISKRHKSGPPAKTSECFFCLANPNIATHLVVSIAEEAYLTMARGPLGIDTTFENIDFPTPILIIPTAHEPTLLSIQPNESRDKTVAEMQRYRLALSKMIAAKSSGALGTICWEVSRFSGLHTHWQLMPYSADMISKQVGQAAFEVEAENLGYPSVTSSEVPDGQEQEDSFNIWLWHPDGEQGKLQKLTMPLDTSFRFDLQMGRRVLAKLLSLEARTNWKDCTESPSQEEAAAGKFKEAFKEFDFSL